MKRYSETTWSWLEIRRAVRHYASTNQTSITGAIEALGLELHGAALKEPVALPTPTLKPVAKLRKVTKKVATATAQGLIAKMIGQAAA